MDDRIKRAIDAFDFEKVQGVMAFMNWKWQFDGGMRVPNIADIRDLAENLLADVATITADPYFISSGGLRADKISNVLHLSFEVETSES